MEYLSTIRIITMWVVWVIFITLVFMPHWIKSKEPGKRTFQCVIVLIILATCQADYNRQQHTIKPKQVSEVPK